jgi:hypothetical protein
MLRPQDRTIIRYSKCDAELVYSLTLFGAGCTHSFVGLASGYALMLRMREELPFTDHTLRHRRQLETLLLLADLSLLEGSCSGISASELNG